MNASLPPRRRLLQRCAAHHITPNLQLTTTTTAAGTVFKGFATIICPSSTVASALLQDLSAAQARLRFGLQGSGFSVLWLRVQGFRA